MKIGCLILCFLMAFSIMCTAFAGPDIMPYYTYVGTIKVDFSVDGTIAECLGRIKPKSNEQTSIVVNLQRKSSGGTWSTIATWTDRCASGLSEAGGTKSVTKGYDYRVYATGKVYNSSGSVIETVNKYSSVISY